jgi:hypothetical protein
MNTPVAYRRLVSICAGICVLAAASLLAAAPARAAEHGDTALTLVSPMQSLALTAEQISALPHQEVTAVDPHSKQEHHYSGVPVRDLLAKVDAPLGDKLHGIGLQLAVLVQSKDGYETLFSLAEFDDAFSDRVILLADAEDGKPLPDGVGPYRIVAPGDKRAARWARMVTSLEILRFRSSTR